MYAALFEMERRLGTEQYIFTGNSASELLSKFEEVQSLECLAEMGKRQERSATGKKAIMLLEELLDKHLSGTMTIEDLLSLDIKISLGSIKCIKILEGDDAKDKLKLEYPKAR